MRVVSGDVNPETAAAALNATGRNQTYNLCLSGQRAILLLYRRKWWASRCVVYQPFGYVSPRSSAGLQPHSPTANTNLV